MQSIWSSKGEKLHTRKIEVTTYAYDEERIIVEGSLLDDRFGETHTIAGETLPRGVMHHMMILLLVNCSNLLIEDVDTDLKSVPREACRETIDCLGRIKGMTISKGFTARVKKMAGGNKGCIHLLELILAMAPAVFQGFTAHQSKKSPNFDSDQEKAMIQSLLNTCHVWREDGPLMKVLKK